MTRTRIGVASGLITALVFAACTHDNMRSGSAAGTIPVDSIPSMPDAVVLRVQNDYSKTIHVFAEANEDTTEVASVEPGRVQTVSIAPYLLRYALTSFQVWAEDSTSTLLGPFNLMKGDRVRLVATPNLDSSHVIHDANF
jgi:hypothetical protein